MQNKKLFKVKGVNSSQSKNSITGGNAIIMYIGKKRVVGFELCICMMFVDRK